MKPCMIRFLALAIFLDVSGLAAFGQGAATANLMLEIGATSESVEVEGAGEVLQTQSANVATTIQTKQISQLPLHSRNTIYFLTMLPGVSSAATASPRNSTVNGLPSTAYNIT